MKEKLDNLPKSKNDMHKKTNKKNLHVLNNIGQDLEHKQLNTNPHSEYYFDNFSSSSSFHIYI